MSLASRSRRLHTCSCLLGQAVSASMLGGERDALLLLRRGPVGRREAFLRLGAPAPRALARRVPTLARELDELLAGGVPLRQLTELAGAPGVGKTQLAIQLALNVQIPHAFGGVEGSAVYIDAEGSFLATRALQMAEALVRRLRATASNEAQRRRRLRLDARAMLDRIYVYRVHEAVELLAAIRAAGELRPAAQPPLRLLVVDSVAFHLRHAEMTYARRLQTVGGCRRASSASPSGRGLAAVAVNQVTTKVNDALGTSSLVPALGESWAHVCNLQLLVSWRDGERLASLYKGLPPARPALPSALMASVPDRRRIRRRDITTIPRRQRWHSSSSSSSSTSSRSHTSHIDRIMRQRSARRRALPPLGSRHSPRERRTIRRVPAERQPWAPNLHADAAPHVGDAACSSCAPGLCQPQAGSGRQRPPFPSTHEGSECSCKRCVNVRVSFHFDVARTTTDHPLQRESRLDVRKT